MQTETVIMPRELTAENGAKGFMSGEFFIPVKVPCEDCQRYGKGDCEYCDGSGYITQSTVIPWTTIKAIYAKAVQKLGV